MNTRTGTSKVIMIGNPIAAMVCVTSISLRTSRARNLIDLSDSKGRAKPKEFHDGKQNDP